MKEIKDITHKYLCRYKDGNKKKQITFRATSRAMAIIGLFSIGITCGQIFSLKNNQK